LANSTKPVVFETEHIALAPINLKQSTVLERRDFRNGVLQLESRAYRRKKDGGLTKRGPYWYFHYREGGKQRTLYVGKTDDPEAKVIEVTEGEQ
jgi:hypothetical protein